MNRKIRRITRLIKWCWLNWRTKSWIHRQVELGNYSVSDGMEMLRMQSKLDIIAHAYA